MSPAALAGPRHHLVEVGVPAVGDPRLGAGEDVAVPVALRPGAHRRRVRPRVRLRQGVRPQQLTAQHVGQPPLLLLLGAAGVEPEAGQRVHAHPDAHRGPGARDLLQHLQVDLVALRAPAVLLVEGQAQQPRPTQGPEHLARELLVGLRLRRTRRQLLGDDVAGQTDQVGGLLGGHHAVGRHGVILPGVGGFVSSWEGVSARGSGWTRDGHALRRHPPVARGAAPSSLRPAPRRPGPSTPPGTAPASAPPVQCRAGRGAGTATAPQATTRCAGCCSFVAAPGSTEARPIHACGAATAPSPRPAWLARLRSARECLRVGSRAPGAWDRPGDG